MASFQNMSELLPRTDYFFIASAYIFVVLYFKYHRKEKHSWQDSLESSLVLIIVSPDVTHMNRQHKLLTIQEKSHSTNT